MSLFQVFGNADPLLYPHARIQCTWSWPDKRYPGRLISAPAGVGSGRAFGQSGITLNIEGYGHPGRHSPSPVSLPMPRSPNNDIFAEYEIIPVGGSVITRNNILLNFNPDGGFGSEPHRWLGTTGLKFASLNTSAGARAPAVPANQNSRYTDRTTFYVRHFGNSTLRFKIRMRFVVPTWPPSGSPGATARNWYYTVPVDSREYIIYGSGTTIAQQFYNTIRPKTVAELNAEKNTWPQFNIEYTTPHSGKPWRITRRDQINGSNDSRRVTIRVINTRNIPSGSTFTFKIIPVAGNITANDFSGINWSNSNALEWTGTVSGVGNGIRYARNIFAAGKVINTVDKFKIRVSYDPGPTWSGPATVDTATYSIVKTL